MATKRSRIPRYGTVEIKGHIYYKTYVMDADGKQVALYGKRVKNFMIRNWRHWNKSTMPHFGANPPQLKSIVKSGC